LVENTLFIVTSDNGARATDFYGNDYGHKSCGELRGQKADIWDGGHREPFIIRWPRVVPPGTTSQQLICLGDLMATCAEIVRSSLPKNAAEDSFSFRSAMMGDPDRSSERNSIVHHSGDGMFSIRDERWKLILGLGSGGFTEPHRIEPRLNEPRGQLYDMQVDFQETTNLWDEQPEIVERLSKELDTMISNGTRK
jgi:arylsulfatase A-like enzyme